jgi:hypothetical protein
MDVVSFVWDLFRLLLGSMGLFIIPGIAAAYAIFPRKGEDILEKALLAVSLGISLAIFPVFFANYALKVPINFFSVAGNSLLWTIVFTVLCLYQRKGDRKPQKKELRNAKKKEKKKEEYALLKAFGVIFAILLCFAMVYSIHDDYRFPYHTDEWIDLRIATEIMESGSIGNNVVLEIGISQYIAEFYLLSGMDPVTTYQYLPALFAAFSALTLFIAVYRMTGKYFPALFAVLFFAGLKTNITILGLWFFVAMTLCVPLIYAVFYLIASGLEKGSARHLLCSAYILLNIALIHPCSASFVFPVIIIYLLLRPRLIGKNVAGLMILFSVPFLSFIYFMRYFWKGTIDKTLKFFLDFIVFPVNEFLPWEYYLFLPGFYGWTAIALAVVGVFAIFAYNKEKEEIFVAWGIWTLGSLYMFYNLKFILISPYERTIYYALLTLIPLSGIGLYQVFSWVYALISRLDGRVAVAVCVLLSLLVYADYYGDYNKNRSGLYKVIDEGDYSALSKLAEKGVTGKKVLAKPHTSFAVYPISRNSVVAVSPRTKAPNKEAQAAERFYSGANCTEQTAILKTYKIDYVYSQGAIACPALKEIYSKSGRFLYRVDL